MSASIIPLKISQLALLVSQRKHIPVNVALGYIYDTPFYAKLYDEDAKWWYLDTESLYKLLEQSWESGSRVVSNNVLVFLSFCLYENGELSAEAAVVQLKTHILFNQVSFHTDRVFSQLSFVESIMV